MSSITVRLPDDMDPSAVSDAIVIARKPCGGLIAAHCPIDRAQTPARMAEALRWMADGLDIRNLPETETV